MVKVIGSDPQYVHRVTCKNCSSILEYLLSEVNEFIHYDYAGGSDLCRFIKCPQSDKKVYVK
jgi:hypothetical protein